LVIFLKIFRKIFENFFGWFVYKGGWFVYKGGVRRTPPPYIKNQSRLPSEQFMAFVIFVFLCDWTAACRRRSQSSTVGPAQPFHGIAFRSVEFFHLYFFVLAWLAPKRMSSLRKIYPIAPAVSGQLHGLVWAAWCASSHTPWVLATAILTSSTRFGVSRLMWESGGGVSAVPCRAQAS